jgi:hypothetical protein
MKTRVGKQPWNPQHVVPRLQISVQECDAHNHASKGIAVDETRQEV